MRQNLTVAQIEKLLSGNCISQELMEILENDARVSVIKLYNKWKHRQKTQVEEKQRLAKMFTYEHDFIQKGCQKIAGIDEAGRGPLAGPVVTAAVILPIDCEIFGLNDSKQLTAKQREELFDIIQAKAISVHYCVVSEKTIDELNIYEATRLGMYQALEYLPVKPDAVLIDAVPLPRLTIPSLSLIGGDAISASIAAASVIAKVTRDRIMDKLEKEYPNYGFAKHKGYGTREHLQALFTHGPCPCHRQSFAPVRNWKERIGNGNQNDC